MIDDPMIDPNEAPSTPRRLSLPWLIIHWVIIVNFLIEIAYAGYQVFFVVRPEGSGVGPLGSAASGIDFEMMVTRRLYASEAWIAIAGLAIYLAVTEMLPRRWPTPPPSIPPTPPPAA